MLTGANSPPTEGGRDGNGVGVTTGVGVGVGDPVGVGVGDVLVQIFVTLFEKTNVTDGNLTKLAWIVSVPVKLLV